MSTIGSALTVAAFPSAPETSSASQALTTLQAIPGQIAAQARAAAEARLEVLIETYHRIASLADPATLAVLAQQIGNAAKALGDTAGTASVPNGRPAPSGLASTQTEAAAPDHGGKTVLARAGAVLDTIRRRLAIAASVARHTEGATTARAAVKSAAQDVTEALNAFGSSLTPQLLGAQSLATINLLA